MDQTRRVRNTALRLWKRLPPSIQQELLAEVTQRQKERGDLHVILFDTSGNDPAYSVKSLHWEVDISFDAMNVWLLVADIPKGEREEDANRPSDNS